MCCHTGLVRGLCGQRRARWGRRMGRIAGFVGGCRALREAVGVASSRRPLRPAVRMVELQGGR